MKAFYTILISCFCIGFSWSQTDIASLEYYFNQDPGVGLGTSIDIDPDAENIDQNFSISTTGLPAGTHRLFVRAINTNGESSIYSNKTFVVLPEADANNSDITEVEYYFDQDPGIGNGTVIDLADASSIDEAVTVSTTGLPTGTHRLFVRVKNSNNTYSIYENKTFRVAPSADQNNSDIVEAEYYFNEDPGIGNGTVIDLADASSIDEAVTVSTTGLPTGTHRLFVRVKNSNNTYSIYENKTFRVAPSADQNNSDIVEAEYYFNEDPGIGNGTVIDLTDASSIDEDVTVSTTGLSTGTHRLFVRVKNSSNVHSLYEPKAFRVAPVTENNSASIVAAEYYIDQDPGVGNGSAISVSGDTIDENLTIATSGSLAQGDHYLHIRVQNADGTWSLYERQYFEVSGTLSISSEVLNDIRIYPNPTKDYVNISIPENLSVKSIKLIDLNGKLVFESKQTLPKVDMSSLPQGMYLLQLETDTGALSKRIVKY